MVQNYKLKQIEIDWHHENSGVFKTDLNSILPSVSTVCTCTCTWACMHGLYARDKGNLCFTCSLQAQDSYPVDYRRLPGPGPEAWYKNQLVPIVNGLTNQTNQTNLQSSQKSAWHAFILTINVITNFRFCVHDVVWLIERVHTGLYVSAKQASK